MRPLYIEREGIPSQLKLATIFPTRGERERERDRDRIEGKTRVTHTTGEQLQTPLSESPSS